MRSGKSESSSGAFCEKDIGNRDADMDSASFDASLWAEAEAEAGAWRARHKTFERVARAIPKPSEEGGEVKQNRQQTSRTRQIPVVAPEGASPKTTWRSRGALSAQEAQTTLSRASFSCATATSSARNKALAVNVSSRVVQETETYRGQSQYRQQTSKASILSMAQEGLPAFAGTAALYGKSATKVTSSEGRQTTMRSSVSRASQEDPWQGIREMRTFSKTREGSSQGIAENAATNGQAPLTVSETIERLRGALEGVVDGLWISGEVATVTRSTVGHLYFSLKDENGLIECVYYRRRSSYREDIKSTERVFQVGDRIEVRGRADMYAPRGRLQLVIATWQPAGAGSLYEAFLKLRAKLELEGLFLKERKKSFPSFIRRVAVVTSSQAAAYRDVIRTIERRTPWVKVLFAETLVQGREAPAAIIAALHAADRAQCDAILLVRGGGAYEDLQAFNDEQVARTLAALCTPVICGIGHESDVTIADLVADLRASTPTAAAEAIGQDQVHWGKRLDGLKETLEKSMERHLQHAMQHVDFVSVALPHPLRKIDALQNRLTLMEGRFADPNFVLSAPTRRLKQVERQFVTPETFISLPLQRFNLAVQRFGAPDALLATYKRREDDAENHFLATANLCEDRRTARLSIAQERLETAPQQVLATLTQRLNWASGFVKPPENTLKTFNRRVELAATALVLADPERPLRAGYARVEYQGTSVSGVSALATGEAVTLIFADGRAEATLERIEKKKVDV